MSVTMTMMAAFFGGAAVAAHVPPPPTYATPFTMWQEAEHVAVVPGAASEPASTQSSPCVFSVAEVLKGDLEEGQVIERDPDGPECRVGAEFLELINVPSIGIVLTR